MCWVEQDSRSKQDSVTLLATTTLCNLSFHIWKMGYGVLRVLGESVKLLSRGQYRMWCPRLLTSCPSILNTATAC